MKTKRTHYQLLMDCVDLLEEWLRGIDPKVETHILLKEIQETTTKKPGGFAPNPYITQQYEKAKQLVRQGKMIKDACKATGLTLDQWYRRKRMEGR